METIFNNNEFPATFSGTGEGRLYVNGVQMDSVPFEVWQHPSGASLPMVDVVTFNELVAESVEVRLRQSSALGDVQAVVERPYSLDDFTKYVFDDDWPDIDTRLPPGFGAVAVLLIGSLSLLIAWLLLKGG